MTDLATTYLGLKLKNPLVVSAAQPLSTKVETVQRLEEAGAAAVVMYSLFEEQIIHESLELDHYLTYGTESYAEAINYYPQTGNFTLAPEAYVETLSNLKRTVKIPVIGSLNGISTGGWIKYASRIQDAGADALELNLYYLPTDPRLNSHDLEENYVTLVNNVCKSIKIPVAVKLSPFFTALPNLAGRLVEAGAKGLVLFNRFYQPDINIEELCVEPSLILSTSQELRLPLRWIAILHGHINADLAITGGIHTAQDVLKSMMVGANVAMLASALLQKGTGYISQILADLERWTTEHEYESIQQMQGSLSQKTVREPAAFERANYMKILHSFKSLP